VGGQETLKHRATAFEREGFSSESRLYVFAHPIGHVSRDFAAGDSAS
jgi:hypothetical protein